MDSSETYLYSVSFLNGDTNIFLTSLDISYGHTAALRYSKQIAIQWVDDVYCSVAVDSTDAVLFILGMNYHDGFITNEIWTYK